MSKSSVNSVIPSAPLGCIWYLGIYRGNTLAIETLLFYVSFMANCAENFVLHLQIPFSHNEELLKLEYVLHVVEL